jgi:hypothetical protein
MDLRMTWAITPRGAGKPVGARTIEPGWALADGETFTVDAFADGMVLGDDGVSLRAPSVDLVSYAADARWRKETGGITLPGNIQISTNADSQSKIAAAKTAFDNGALNGFVKFKAVNGWMDANAATLTAVYRAVVKHVQDCYAAEHSVAAGITAGTITTTEQIDAAFAAL